MSKARSMSRLTSSDLQIYLNATTDTNLSLSGGAPSIAFETFRLLEREKGELKHQLNNGLERVRGKFSYERYNGLSKIREAVLGLEKKSPAIIEGATDLIKSLHVNDIIFNYIIKRKDKLQVITEVQLKEKVLALETLLALHQYCPFNPHSRGIIPIVALVVETAKPVIQLPALLYLRAMMDQSAPQKSFAKTAATEAIAKWWREQTLAAGSVGVDRTMSDVLQAGASILSFLGKHDAHAAMHREVLRKVLGPEKVAALMARSDYKT